MNLKSFVSEVYNSIDQADATKFAGYISPNGIFRFANQPAVAGREAIKGYVDGFFKSLKGIAHSELEFWQAEGVIFVNGMVQYTRHNNTVLEVPFSCTWKMAGDQIEQYLIFIDNSTLYQ